jgi:hypothetical protein
MDPVDGPQLRGCVGEMGFRLAMPSASPASCAVCPRATNARSLRAGVNLDGNALLRQAAAEAGRTSFSSGSTLRAGTAFPNR